MRRPVVSSLSVVFILLCAGLPSAGCSGTSKGNAAVDGGSGGSGGHGGAVDASFADGGGAGAAGGRARQDGGSSGAGGSLGGKLGTTQCTDGIDNDGDGRIDLADPECVSPLDNDESSFATGIPGDNVDACKQDCFFDGNSGMGDDGCQWQLKCDPANTGAGAASSCPYDPTVNNCPTVQSAKCIMNCGAVTPNGCDCFGCCAVPGVNHPIRLDPSCTSASFDNPALCPACTQQASCMKTCGKCQLCIGKTTLDPSCSTVDGGVPVPTCPGTQIVCGTNADLCPSGTMCVTGCCVPWVF